MKAPLLLSGLFLLLFSACMNSATKVDLGTLSPDKPCECMDALRQTKQAIADDWQEYELDKDRALLERCDQNRQLIKIIVDKCSIDELWWDKAKTECAAAYRNYKEADDAYDAIKKELKKESREKIYKDQNASNSESDTEEED